MSVEINAPERLIAVSLPSYLSGKRAHRDAQEREAENPPHPRAAQQTAKVRSHQTRSGMIGGSRKEDPKNDRHGVLKACGEHQRQDLRLIANLGETDDHGRYEEGFHADAIGVGREINLGTAPSARPGCREPMPKVSPSLWARARHRRGQAC